ncbi:MAG: hypothetical protein MZW92_27925 [Comamonadaceae bacterium]|nr:hypothetical protein [Comamonadaceae bacterium]
MAVLAVIAAIAAPGMRGFVLSPRVPALSNDLATDLLLARSEALEAQRDGATRAAAVRAGVGWTVAAGNTVLDWRGATGYGVVVDAPAAILFSSNGRVSSPTTRLRA